MIFFANSKEVGLKNVVDADSSQIEAIVRAKNGESADSMIFGKNLKWIYDVKKGTKNMVWAFLRMKVLELLT